jgi:tape measure domain-containing protein
MAESIVKLIVDATQGVRSLGRFKKATNEAKTATSQLTKLLKAQSTAALEVKAATESAQGGYTKLSQVQGVLSARVLKTERAIGAQISALRDVRAGLKLNGPAYKRVTEEIQRLEKSFERSATKAEKFRSKLGGLKGAIVSLGVAALTKRMIGQAASFQQTQIRLKALSTEYGEFSKIQQLVKDNAKTFNLSQAEAATQFSDVYARLRPLGKTLDEVQTVYKGFNATAIASGTSAAAASGAFLQLSQALGSGRLQGDEFRSIAEQVPGILKLVSDEMGVAVSELKKLGSEGKITSDILINALAKGFEKNKDKIQQILAESPAAKFKEFSNATSELSNAIGTELLPVVTPAVQKLTELLKVVGELPGPIKTVGAAILGLTSAVVVLAPLLGPVAKGFAAIKAVLAGITGAGLLAAGPWFALAAGIGAAAFALNNYQFEAKNAGTAENLKRRGAELLKIDEDLAKAEARRDKQTDKQAIKAAQLTVDNFQDIRQRKLKEIAQIRGALPFRQRTKQDVPKQDQFKIGDFVGGGGSAGSAGPDPAEEARKLAQLSRDRVQSFEDQALLASAVNETERKNFQLNIDIAELQKNALGFAQKDVDAQVAARIALENKRNEAEAYKKTIAETAKEEADSLARFLSDFDAAFQELDAKAKAQADKMDALYASIGQTISTSIVDSLTAAVDGTKRLSDVASDTLRSLASILLKFGVNSLLSGLAGDDGVGVFSKLFGGGRAKGGTVMGGKAYMVGERGPELFTPGRSGSIAPNSSIGGGANVVVNVDASGTKAEGDGRQANQLGAALGAAVQAELIKQKRPGGLLAA